MEENPTPDQESELTGRKEAIEELHGIADDILRAETASTVAEVVAESMRVTLDMPLNAVLLHDEHENVLEPVAWTDRAREMFGDIPTFHPGESIAWKAFARGETKHYDDVSTAPDRLNPDTPIRSEILLPLGEHGVVTIGSTDVGVFDDVDVSLAETIATHAEIALDRIDRTRALQRREAFLEQSLDITVVLTADGTIQYVSPSVESELGYEPDELVGRNGFELIHPDDREKLWETFEELVADREGQMRTEARFRSADGGWRWVEFQGNNRLDAEPIDGVVVSGRDVTERKHHQERLEQLQRRTQELMHTKTKQETAEVAVKTATEDLGVPIAGFHVHDDATGTLAPIAFRDEMGVFDTRPEFEQTDDRQAVADFVWTVFEDGDPVAVGDVQEHDQLAGHTPIRSVFLYPLDGHGIFIVSATEPAAFDEADRMLLTILGTSLLEAFDRADREQELRDRTDSLARQNDRLEEFASVVSHDLRNPLQVATARLEMAAGECESEHIDTAGNALDRMDALIDDLLTLAREGEEVGDVESVALEALAERCWETVETDDATLVIETDRTVRADGSRLQQLVENFVRNAVEHGSTSPRPASTSEEAEHGRHAVTVTIGDLEDGFYVEDDGPGIPEDAADHVFTAGYSTAEEGTGFGLAIVKQVAEAHGWEISVTEGSTGGARFEITGVELPAE